MSQAWREGALWLLAIAGTLAAALVPHALDHGWAWGWPLGGRGFDAGLVLDSGWIAFGVALVLWAGRTSPVGARGRRCAGVIALLGLHHAAGCELGGLARSRGRGLAERVRAADPRALQAWAVAAIDTRRTPDALPPRLARAFPEGATLERHSDHVEVRWYDCGILAGRPGFVGDSRRFFFERVEDGVYVFVDER